MPRPTRLPDIRDLTEDTRADWRARARTLADLLLVCGSLMTVVFAAVTIWEFRRGSPFPALVHGLFAGFLVVGAVTAGLVVARRHGREIVSLIAVIAPVVVWLLVCCFAFVMAGVEGS